jgi:hypothetical protein
MNTKKQTFVIALGMMITLSFASLTIFSQDQEDKQSSDSVTTVTGNTLEGVWQLNITAYDCHTGTPIRTFKALNTFMQGGTQVEDSSTSSIIRGTSHGIWQSDNRSNYISTFVFFRFNADGTPNGSQRVRRIIKLNENFNHFTANGTVEIFNVNGDLIATGCSTEAATRFTF